MPTRSVVHANVNVLLAWVGDDFLLPLALEVWQLLNSLLNDLEGTLNFLVGDDERWRQANDILVSGFSLHIVSQLRFGYAVAEGDIPKAPSP